MNTAMYVRFRRVDAQETYFDRWIRAARDGLFGVLLTMSKGTHSHFKWSLFGMTWDFLQLLAYALYGSSVFPWYNMPNMKWLITFLLFVNPTSATLQVAPLAAVVLLFAACTWITATIAAAAWSAYSFSVGDFSSVLPLKFLRATGGLTVVLFVPVAGLLISTFKCHSEGNWSGTSWPCWGPAHLSVVAVVVVLLPAFWLFCIAVSAVFFDRNYRSDNITARAHGRVAITMVTIKTGLTLVFTVLAEAGGPWFLVAVCVLCGCGWLYLWLRFLPAYTQGYNRAWAAFGSIFLWASLCTALALLLNNPEEGVAGWVFYVGAPTAAYAGYSCAYLRWVGFTDRAVGMKGAVPGGPGLRTPFDVELRARCILRDVIAEERLAHAGAHNSAVTAPRIALHGSSNTHAPGGEIVIGGQAEDSVPSHAAPGGEADTGLGEHAAGVEAVPPRRASQARVSQVAPIVPSAGQAYVHGSDGDEASLHLPPTSTAHGSPSQPGLHASSAAAISPEERAALVASAGALFDAGCAAFPTAAIMDLLRANFIRTFVGDTDAELACLSAGLAKEPSIDVRFLLLQCKQELLEAGGNGAVVVSGDAAAASSHEHVHQPEQHHHHHHQQQHGHHPKQSIVEKVIYEKLVAESTEWSLKSRCIELSFWTELRRPEPSLTSLHSLSERLSAAIVRAESSFERLMTMRPDSLEAVQSYAVFLLEVKRDAAAADRYFARADEILRERGDVDEAGGVTGSHALVPAEAALVPEMRSRDAARPSGISDRPAAGPGASDPVFSTDENAAAEVISVSTHQSRDVDPVGSRKGLDHRGSPSKYMSSRARPTSPVSDTSAATRVSYHPNTPWHDPLLIDTSTPPSGHAIGEPEELKLDQAQQEEGRQRRRSSLAGRVPTGSTAHSDSANNPTQFMVFGSRRASGGISPPFNSPPSQAAAGSMGADGVGGLSSAATLAALAARTITDGSTYSDTEHRRMPKRMHTPSSVDSGGGAKTSSLLAKKAHAVIALNRYADIARRRRKSSIATEEAAAVTAAAAAATVFDAAVLAQSGDGPGSPLVQLPSYDNPAARAGRRNNRDGESVSSGEGSPDGREQTEDPLSQFALRRSDLERAELGMSARELEQVERERESRVAATTKHARKTEARLRQEAAIESAALSLRHAITSHRDVMEPQLVALSRALLAFFVAAAILNIIMVALLSVQTASLKSTAALVRLSSQRQLYVESILHRAHELVLVNAGILAPFAGETANATGWAVIELLATDAVELDSVHRQLLADVQGGAALSAEVSLYSDKALAVRYLGAAASAPAGIVTPQTKLMSFGDLGLEIAATAATLVGSTPPAEFSSSNPDVWFLFDNGPGVVRAACNASTVLLVQRADAQATGIQQVNFGIAASGVLAFSLLLLLCLFPIILVVKLRSDQVFAIFLRLPDALLRDMQYGCAAQVAELRSLFVDHETFALCAGPVDSSLLSAAAAELEADDSGVIDASLTATVVSTAREAQGSFAERPGIISLGAYDRVVDSNEQQMLEAPASASGTVSPPRDSSSPLAVSSSSDGSTAPLSRKPSGSDLVERRKAPRKKLAGGGGGRSKVPPHPFFIDLSPVPELHAKNVGDGDEEEDLSDTRRPFRLGAPPMAPTRPAADVGGVHVVQAGGGVSAGLSISEVHTPALGSPASGDLSPAASFLRRVGSSPGMPHLLSMGSKRALGRVVDAAVIAQVGEALVPSLRPPSRGDTQRRPAAGSARILHAAMRALGSPIEGSGAGAAADAASGGSMRYGNELLSPRGEHAPLPRVAAATRGVAAAPGATPLAPLDGASAPRNRRVASSHLMLHVARSFFAGTPPPPERSFRASWKTMVVILLRFCWPVLLFTAYYMGAYGYTANTLSSLVTQRRLVAVLSQLQAALPPGNLRVLSVLTDSACPTTTVFLSPAVTLSPVVPGDPWHGTACSAAQLHAAASLVDAAADSVTLFTNAFVYGDPAVATSVPAVSASSTALRVMFQNACVDDAEQPGCSSFFGGVVGTGLLATLTTYSNALRQALQHREADVRRAELLGGPCPAVGLSINGSASAAWVADEISSIFAQPALNVLAVEFQGSLSSTVSVFIVGLAVLTVVAVFTLAAVYWLFMSNAFRRMDVDLKRTRAMLLLFPSDILASVAAFLHLAGQSDVLGVSPQATEGRSSHVAAWGERDGEP